MKHHCDAWVDYSLHSRLAAVGLAVLTALGQAACGDSTAPLDYSSGLEVSYSNGVNVVETVILHGWRPDTECGHTDNNLYQGVCVPLADSPVDWAWGSSFSADWSGFISIPEAGDYVFTSWVDGEVFISVDGTVVADLNTVGDTYSGTVAFQQGGWYPISMTFATNGGSNGMHLGWQGPGVASGTVPADNLGYR